MLKKYSILALFFIAYTIVLAHGIIPHHHDDDHDISQTSDHDHDDDSPLAKAFSHFHHISSTKEILYTDPSDNTTFQKNDFAKYFLATPDFCLQLFSPPAPNDFSEQIFYDTSISPGSSRLLRAPPLSC